MLPNGKSILITDFEEEYYDEDDKFIGSMPTIFVSIPNGEERKEWLWNFDAKMMYQENCKTMLRVTAVQLY